MLCLFIAYKINFITQAVGSFAMLHVKYIGEYGGVEHNNNK